MERADCHFDDSGEVQMGFDFTLHDVHLFYQKQARNELAVECGQPMSSRWRTSLPEETTVVDLVIFRSNFNGGKLFGLSHGCQSTCALSK
jgi:hypothetical protein